MKVGLIRCLQTEDMCPATTCLKMMNTKKLAFDGIKEDMHYERITYWICLPPCRADESSDHQENRRGNHDY